MAGKFTPDTCRHIKNLSFIIYRQVYYLFISLSLIIISLQGPVLSSQHVHHHQHTGRTQCDVRSQEIKSESIQEKTTSSQSQIPKTEEPKTTEKEEQKPPKGTYFEQYLVN